ncbi:unnamed protein product [Lactuca saligna]|uniref:Bifunctional inhibitor/plant lipid transfer protein/seed storage helical domain-containing protein n=1 Tax=Lactuca saligna TaxID=75948 RepID=A0AA35YPU7_LACSI|nr:unnamed protein product [Lactuca saligna]
MPKFSGINMFLIVAILMVKVHVGTAVDCDIMKLLPCYPFIKDPTLPAPSPDSDCCNNLRMEEPCLCDFAKNPVFGSYLNNPSVKKVADACSVAIPDPKTCH